MRFMILIKATADSDAGVMPGAERLEARGKYTREWIDAGVRLAGDGLRPSRDGARVHFRGGRHVVTDGPFVETKELIAGFWMWQVDSLEQAIEWV
ncbi:MAG: YciI family protein, partial [Pseudazoarcus pumilus]|nr:YciI family protein [Pseudazoarcus pumilus]